MHEYVLPYKLLTDRNISLAAKGMYGVLILDVPMSKLQIIHLSNTPRGATYDALDELVEAGWVDKRRKSSGVWRYYPLTEKRGGGE